MKSVIYALTLCLLASPVLAVDVEVGPGGIRIDEGRRDRDWREDRHHDSFGRDYERREVTVTRPA
jgi:hypothetical protein